MEPANGTEIQLIDALMARLEITVQYLAHPTDPNRDRTQEFKAPRIVDGWLPPKRSRVDAETDEVDETDFPCVIVRAGDGSTETIDGWPQDSVGVKLIIGSYGSVYGDHRYCLVVMRRIINDLRRDNCLPGNFRMKPEITWKMVDEQNPQVWFLEMMTRWEVPTPREETEMELDG